MASIIENLQAILTARYGRDVRNAIHDSISDLNEIANTAQTSAKAYYEGTQALAQTVSGNVGIDDSTATLSTTYSSHKIENKTRTNLLNPTLGTTTVNGVTITNNGDGTFIATGTCTAFVDIRLGPWGLANYDNLTKLKVGKYKLTGTPRTSTEMNAHLGLVGNDGVTRTYQIFDEGNGIVLNQTNESMRYEIKLSVNEGAVFNNDIFKPMLTTDLSATYDDFVAYSGDGELNQNVAEMYKTIETLKNAITELGGTV